MRKARGLVSRVDTRELPSGFVAGMGNKVQLGKHVLHSTFAVNAIVPIPRTSSRRVGTKACGPLNTHICTTPTPTTYSYTTTLFIRK